MMLHQEPALAETSAIQRSRLFDSPWLAMALVAVLCVNGISWGRTEIWNADQMALMDHFREGKLPFSPEHFEKPPLMGYMNFVFSVVPREILTVTVSLVTGSDQDGKFDYVSVWLAKILHVLLATGCVYLLFRLVVDFSGPRIASILALLFASSARTGRAGAPDHDRSAGRLFYDAGPLGFSEAVPASKNARLPFRRTLHRSDRGDEIQRSCRGPRFTDLSPLRST